MFPLEAMIIVLVLTFAIPPLTKLKLVDKRLCYIERTSRKALAIKIVLLTALSIALVVMFFALNDSVDFKFTFDISDTVFSQWFNK